MFHYKCTNKINLIILPLFPKHISPSYAGITLNTLNNRRKETLKLSLKSKKKKKKKELLVVLKIWQKSVSKNAAVNLFVILLEANYCSDLGIFIQLIQLETSYGTA